MAKKSPTKKSPAKKSPKQPPVVDIDPATLLFIGSLFILLPLLATGFISQ